MSAFGGPAAELDELEAKLAARTAQLRDLATMGTVITRIHEIDAVLSVVMDMAIRLVEGEVGLIMIAEDDCLRPEVCWGVSEDFIKSLIYEDGIDLVTYCHRNRQPVVLSGLDLRWDGGIKLDSVIAMPIQTADECLGVMVIINKTNGGAYTDDDTEILRMLLNFVAVAIDNSRLLKDKLVRQKIEQEMLIARQVQETILPRDDTKIDGAEIGAVYFPAREVGGDFYDILRIDEQRFLVILGDVSNKGVPAALVMSALSGIVKSVMLSDPTVSVAELAGRLNDILATEIIKDREMFVTLFFARFDLEAKELTYCNAGHVPGLYWDSTTTRIEELAKGGPIVGQFEGIAFTEGRCGITGGDRLFLFTDGLTEAEDADHNLFGRERAEQVFGTEIGLAPKEFCLRVKEWVDHFTEGASKDSQDDFTVLQVRVE